MSLLIDNDGARWVDDPPAVAPLDAWDPLALLQTYGEGFGFASLDTARELGYATPQAAAAAWSKGVAAYGAQGGYNSQWIDLAGTRGLLEDRGLWGTPAGAAWYESQAARLQASADAYAEASEKKSRAGLLTWLGGLAAVVVPGVLGLYPGQAGAAVSAASSAGEAINVAQGLKLGGDAAGLTASVIADAPLSAGLAVTNTGGVTGLVAPAGFQLAPGVGSSVLGALQGVRLPSPLGASSAASSPAIASSAPSLGTVTGAASAAAKLAGAGASLAGVLGLASSSSPKPAATHLSAGAQQSEAMPAPSASPLGIILLAAAGVAVAIAVSKRKR
jgi:hypothetical protein